MQNSSDSPEVKELTRKVERSRADLAQTVHLLRSAVSDAGADFSERIAPETIKANVGDYLRARGGRMMEVARQNPLQAAAIGAMAAYPTLAVARRIPAPLMMIGAGLFLLSSEAGRQLSQKATDGAGNLAERGQRMAQDWRDKSADTLASVSEQTTSVAASVRDSVSNASGDVSASAKDLSANAMNSFRSAAAPVDALTNWARKNPMIAAAIGLAVGGLVASAIPVTDAEARLAETANSDLRRRLGDAADQAVAAATEAANQIAERTHQQGLAPEALAEAARDYGERALNVAEATVDAALSRDGHIDSHTPAGG